MKKVYLIVANHPEKGQSPFGALFGGELKYWNFGIGNGAWSTVGSYYFDEESAQRDIEEWHLDAHIEQDVIGYAE